MKKLANRRNKRTNYSIIIFLELLKYRDGEADLGSGIRDPRDPNPLGSGIRATLFGDPGSAGSGIRAMKRECLWDPGSEF